MFDPGRDIIPGGLKKMAEMSGGLPRHAIMMFRDAIPFAMRDGSVRLTPHHIEAGIREVGEMLGRRLNEEHLKLLERVACTRNMPGDENAATLFADGSILAYPPQHPSVRPQFVVHPLLRADIEGG